MRRPAPSRHPAIGPRELARRERDLRRRIGVQIRQVREDLGATRMDLARAVGVSHSHISRVEAGTVGMSLSTHLAVATALGCDLGVRLFPGTGAPIRDRFQAPIVEALIRALHPSWTARLEAPVGSPARSIDLVIGRGRLSVASEVQSELRRLEAIVRRAAETEAALGADGGTESTSRLLVVRSTASSRAVARQFAATLRAAYPARTADAFDALVSGERSWPGAAILWAKLEAGHARILRFPPRGVTVGR